MNIREFQSASSRDFSLLKAPTTTSTIKNLLRHFAKQAFKHCIVDVKLGCLSLKIINVGPFSLCQRHWLAKNLGTVQLREGSLTAHHQPALHSSSLQQHPFGNISQITAIIDTGFLPNIVSMGPSSVHILHHTFNIHSHCT